MAFKKYEILAEGLFISFPVGILKEVPNKNCESLIR